LKGDGQNEHFLYPGPGDAVREAAERADMTLSAWLAEAAADGREAGELRGVAGNNSSVPGC
jgi:hypothetical protein